MSYSARVLPSKTNIDAVGVEARMGDYYLRLPGSLQGLFILSPPIKRAPFRQLGRHRCKWNIGPVLL